MEIGEVKDRRASNGYNKYTSNKGEEASENNSKERSGETKEREETECLSFVFKIEIRVGCTGRSRGPAAHH